MQKIKPPFFEIGPKAYLYGDELLQLAQAADEASRRYGVQVIFTPQPTEIRLVAQNTTDLLVFAQHMDPLPAGRGMGKILPEAVKAAGACGVMLNHAEMPLSLADLKQTILRAREVGLTSIVCADSVAEARAVACLAPDIIVAEPTELIGTGQRSDTDYIYKAIQAVREINSDIQILIGAGIHDETDVYEVMRAGADATGATSGIIKAENPREMVFKMLEAARRAWDERQA